ncbi:MAG: metal ABC transporter permease [Fervidicoccaceae archaeon]
MSQTKVFPLIAALSSAAVLSFAALKPVSLSWLAATIGACLAFGSLSPLLVARRMLFLGGALPHAALLASAVGYISSIALDFNYFAAAAIAGALMSAAIGLAASRSADPDRVVAASIGLTASLGVLTTYYVASEYPGTLRVSTLLLGDPLLAGEAEALGALVFSMVVMISVSLIYKEVLLIGLQPNEAELTGLRARLYDAFFYCLLGLAVVTMLRIVGYVMTHVLLLIPGSAGASASSSSRGALAASVAFSMSSAALSLFASSLLDVSPNAVAGLVLLAIYVAIASRGRRG